MPASLSVEAVKLHCFATASAVGLAAFPWPRARDAGSSRQATAIADTASKVVRRGLTVGLLVAQRRNQPRPQACSEGRAQVRRASDNLTCWAVVEEVGL